MGRPLVSVITPTWQRRDMLLDAIANVRGQDYPNLEHIIVSDGPDPELRDLVTTVQVEPLRFGWIRNDESTPPPIRFAELGLNWSGTLANFGVAPLTVGMFLARGHYQIWFCDDERMDADHISSLVDALESSGADFAYSRCRMWWTDRPGHSWEIGSDPPRFGQITNFLYRTSLLNCAMPAWGGHPVDWTLVEAWMAAGALWAFTGRTTISHRADR